MNQLLAFTPDRRRTHLNINPDGHLYTFDSNVATQLNTITSTAVNQEYTNSNLVAILGNTTTLVTTSSNILVDTSLIASRLDNKLIQCDTDNITIVSDLPLDYTVDSITAHQGGTWSVFLSNTGGIATETTLSNVLVDAALIASTLDSGVISVDDNGSSLTVDNGGTFAVQPNTMPVVQGTNGNLWNNVVVVTNDTSSVVDCQYAKQIDILGNLSNIATVTMQHSVDNSNWYSSIYSYTSTGAEDFHISFQSGARYIRLIANSDTQITASLCAKH